MATRKDTTTTTDIKAKLSWLPKKTFELEMTIPKGDVTKEYKKVLTKTTKETTLKGFRKGKAPEKMVEEYVGKSKLYDETVNQLVTQAYFDAVKQHNLSPVTAPKIEPISMKEGEDWTVKATSCESPEVKLGDYKDAVKSIKAKDKIWTPDKAGQEKKEENNEKSLEQILEAVSKACTVEMSDILIDKETNRLMSNLLDQVNALGMTIQQYLQTKNMTQEQLRSQYQRQAEEVLKLEFILPKIADAEKIVVDDKEVDELIAKTKDEKAKKQMQEPSQRYYLLFMLRKQKTIDFLKSL